MHRFLCLAGVVLAIPFHAVALVDANSAANTNAPPDGAPWINVGTISGASGIYLGDAWVLTANHVGPGSINLNGTTYPYSGTFQQLTNANGSGADMLVFRLASKPNLPSLPLVATTPAASTPVDMIGYGYIAGSSETTIGVYTGFYWAPHGRKGWGNNRVAAGGLQDVNAGGGTVTAFVTDFTAPGPMQASHEAQAAPGDSGGGVFVNQSGTWHLAGMMFGIDNLPLQPANTSVYGDLTYSANIATYGNQILSLIGRAAPLRLTISPVGADVMVCWPDTAAGYTLESTANLTPAPAWTTVAQNLSSTNGQGCIRLPATGGPRFFRLISP
ncbi:MAG TPA: trypsin-like serine protease [Clostridia bacterium]|nr:trypsin-like serine protease [Clostridia bacterium]